jgi:regulator of sigma E protease
MITILTTLLTTIIVLSVLILVHELGHFFMAKLFRIRVDRFSIGLPPRLIGKKVGETDYCISAVPFGGYVKMAGMVDESFDKKQIEKEPKPWEFRSKPWGQRFLVLLTGSVMNLLLAYGIFAAATLIQGVAEVKSTFIGKVIEGRPAERAGLKANDRIIRLNRKSIQNWNQLTQIVHASPGIPLLFEWMRGDSVLSATITPVKEKEDIREVGLVGIMPQYEMKKVGLFHSLRKAGEDSYYFVKLIIVYIYKLIIGSESFKSIGGVISIYKIVGDSSKYGLSGLFLFMAFFSLSLGILNLLPFPVLDGGYILMLCIEGIMRREIPLKVKIIVLQVGWVLLIGLMLLAVRNDILRFFNK